MSRLLLATLVAIAIATAGCGEAQRVSGRDDASSQLATPGHDVTSSSGSYVLHVVTGQYSGDDGSGDFWRIQISDRAGKLLHDSPKRFAARFATEVLWDDHSDRAWVRSADVGAYYFDRAGDGSWDATAMTPRAIASGSPPLPALLVARYPEAYGPAGRAKARRLIDAHGSGGGDLNSGIPDDDPRLTR